jgi:hypothetical protein
MGNLGGHGAVHGPEMRVLLIEPLKASDSQLEMERVEERRPASAEPEAAPRPLDGRDRGPGRAESRVERLLRSRRLQLLAATVAYLGFAIYLTWPLVTDLDHRIYGAVGDLTGAMSNFRELIESGRFPFAPGTLHDFAAPEGFAIRWTLNISTVSSFSLAYLLSWAFGPIAGFGIYLLAGFTLSGVAMFLLVRRLVGHAGVAFVAGYLYAFYPFVVVKAQGHVDFVHGWVLVMLAWRLLELMERPTVRNGVYSGLALLLVFTWTPYHILFGGAMALALAVVALSFAWRRRQIQQTLIALVVTGGIGLAWLGGIVLLNTAAPRDEIRSHSIQEAIVYSARAFEYVVPTSEHPLVGKSAGKYRADHMHGSNISESTLYVGISVIVLALLGLVTATWRGGSARRAAIAAAVLVIAGFALSAPPRVDLLGVNFPTATQFLFDLTSTWRAFSRFVVVVMLGLVLLAAMGMFTMVRRRRVLLQGVLLSLLLVITAGDLWAARPAHGTNKIVVPPTYLRLKDLPQGMAVEYPLVPAEQSNYGDLFYQGWYDKPLLNGYIAGSPQENRALGLRDLSDPTTARGLKALGVRYVLVRQDWKVSRLPNPGRPGPQFRLITKDPYIALYELRVPGDQVLVTPMDGFAPTEGVGSREFQWLLEREGTIELRGSCSPCIGTVRMKFGSFSRPRDVTVRAPNGAVLARARGTSRTLRFPVTFARRLVLRVSATPGPQSIAATTGSADQRSVSIAVTRESFELRRSGG